MKKRFCIALTLALALTIVSSGIALAWDLEDPCVADNNDFFVGMGVDTDKQPLIGEFHFGGQAPIPDGYNLYRDDVTNTGSLDIVGVQTWTPENIDLPNIELPVYRSSGWVIGSGFGQSQDTWYWAPAPRGYNIPRKNRIRIELPNAWSYFERCGKATPEINYTDGVWLIHIPKGTWVLKPDGSKASRIVVNTAGIVTSDVEFHYTRGGEITITKL